MAGEPQKVTFEKVDWDDRAVADLSRIDGLTDADFAFYARSIAARDRGLMGVFVGAERVASIVWGLADEPHGRVFIIDEMGGETRRGVDLIGATHAMAHQLAPTMGATALRFLTRRRAFLKRLEGEFQTTFILEKRL